METESKPVGSCVAFDYVDYHNSRLKAIMDELEPIVLAERSIMFGMRGHWDVWVCIHDTPGEYASVTTKIMDTNRHSIKNARFYERVWQELMHRVGDDASARTQAYQELVHKHTGFLIKF